LEVLLKKGELKIFQLWRLKKKPSRLLSINRLEKLYNFNDKEVENFIFYIASTNIKADEVTVIKAKDVNNVENIKQNFFISMIYSLKRDFLENREEVYNL